MCDARDILAEVLAGYSDHNKWIKAPFERIKRISNSKVGDVGQEFVERLCKCKGFQVEFPETVFGKRARQSPWDIEIEGMTFELKTATEDISGCFQFNHIRYHREYDALLCIGISPSDIYFGIWSKAQVTTGKAGNLATMEMGANASYKLTKRPNSLFPMTEFEQRILDVVTNPDS